MKYSKINFEKNYMGFYFVKNVQKIFEIFWNILCCEKRRIICKCLFVLNKFQTMKNLCYDLKKNRI